MTPDEILNMTDDQLRCEAALILDSGPWPKIDSRSWPEIVEDLQKKVHSGSLKFGVKAISSNAINPRGHDWLFWYVFSAAPIARVRACLVALELERSG